MTKEAPSSYTLHEHPRQQSKVEQTVRQIAQSPYPALFLSAINLAALKQAGKRARGYPTVMQCMGYTGIFGASSYALGTGDSVNGSGLAFVWSAIWLFFNARNAWKSRRLVPLTMAGAVAAIGSSYGFHYFTYGW
ncbi:hypothetical protein IWW36_001570 [Coemansia brasiliensis]|uniref:Uncharacterized protein n=1 Tax=Coemansia brasiliensis TaxID=2650707 RepID=A0A9W8M0Q2_9FUNG|nr:hypothetical protein IWW36_001570 [Coemansia brasiliensis]